MIFGLIYARSLRGDLKKESGKSKEEKVVVSSNAIAIPWWLFPAAGGVIAVSLGAAFWLGRRSSTKMLILREPLSVAQEERIDK